MPRLARLAAVLLVGFAVAEKVFHRRDHSDVVPPSSRQAALITDTDTAEQFLFKYGFIKAVKWEEPPAESSDVLFDADVLLEDADPFVQEGASSSRSGSSGGASQSPDFVKALREFQRVSRLPVTGLFDDATKVAMNKPRCGVPDKEEDLVETTQASPTAQDLNEASTYSGTTPELYSYAVTTNFTIVLNGTTNETLARPKPVTGRKRHLAELVRKSRRKRETGDWGHMAFSKSVLRWRLIGEGYSSQLSVDDQRYVFRLAFRMWSEVSPLEFVEDLHSPLEEIDIRLGFGTGRHLGCAQRFDGAGREFAHAWFLGDIHFDDDEHFTAPNTGNGISLLKVAVHEIGHVLGLPHIYRAGSIMQPSYLPQDAGFELDWLDRKAIQNLYGTQYWRYDSESDQVFSRDGDGQRYPRLISEGFPGVPSPVDTAYYDRRDAHIYFFRGSMVYRFDVRSNRLAAGSPKKMTELFPAVAAGDHPVANLDAAYFSYTHNALFLLKGSSYWRVVGSRERRLKAWLPYNSLLPRREVDQEWFDICDVHVSSLKTARR
ncbi:matrix metallopeptidase-21 isoform X3 [Pygocentrus nattereri]|uniref:matrix metallopeptidase-21 isoform X3 n=1 Tax=Pygocentrus nattereri TaxID=42514 RepID=UPI0008145498|nr:matrix metallopeptidase-21 isoform X3 [Pygocentrus nattereri]